MINKSNVEILAPAGNFTVLQAAVQAGADAVYLGGKLFNMRLHRTSSNFGLDELKQAVDYAHQHSVKLYVTVNNLIQEKELPSLIDYLGQLDALGPDALIIQDLSVLALAHELKLSVPLHASVMMNSHNRATLDFLKSQGATRVVVGRELSLAQIRNYAETSGLEMEYFIHGDMCIAHSGQCYHSGIIFGQSSNRGRCLKPCRWPYDLVDLTTNELVPNQQGPFKMAMKDMCLYPHIPELIQSGVVSFKIEGRMRTPDFVQTVVKHYRKAIDEYFANPDQYSLNQQDWQQFEEERVRDFTSCYALGNPGFDSIGYDGKREPRFFSQAVKEPSLDQAMFPEAKEQSSASFKLSVRTATLEQFKAALAGGANRIYLGGESFHPNRPLTAKDYEAALAEAAQYQAELVFATPRIVMDEQFPEIEQLLAFWNKLRPQGVLISNLGLLHKASTWTDLPLLGDYSLNILNHSAANLLKDAGLVQGTVSIEAPAQVLPPLLAETKIPLELIVHGPLEAMVTDHCFLHANDADKANCSRHCLRSQYALRDTAGETHRLAIDQYCRTHILLAKELCLYPYLQSLKALGVTNFRLEGQHEAPEKLEQLVRAYQANLSGKASAIHLWSNQAAAAYAPGPFSHEILL